MKTLALAAALWVASCIPAFAVQAAETQPTISNADIVNMLANGVPEGTILVAIQYGKTSFDTSPAAIIDLKEHGVPRSIVEAMLRSNGSAQAAGTSQASGTSPEKTQDPSSDSADREPPGQGVYYKGPGGWVKLETIMMSGGGAKKMGKVLVPGLTPHFVWTFRGATAPVHVIERRPIFYVKQGPYLTDIPGQSARDIVMVRFDQKKDHRELQTTSGSSAFTFKAGFSKERTPDIVVTPVSPGLFSLTPSHDLPEGEYLLTFGSVGYTGYDFSIAPSRGKR
jgi:hypothetical protein